MSSASGLQSQEAVLGVEARRRRSACVEELFDGEAGLACDMAKNGGREVAGAVNGNGGPAAVRVAEALVGATLAHFAEAERGEDRDDLARPQRRRAGHRGQTWTVWVPTNSVSGWGS